MLQFAEFMKILLLSETYRRPIGDLLETHRRLACLIGDPVKTNMPARRPIVDWHASSETHRRPICVFKRPICLIGDPSETHRRPTYLMETNMSQHRPIGDQHASSETHRRPTCLIGDPSKTNMPHQIYIGDRQALSETHKKYISCSNQACQSPLRHVGHQWVSN